MNDALLERMRENLKWFSGEALRQAGETAETATTVDYWWEDDMVVISMRGKEIGRVHKLALAAESPAHSKSN